MSSTPINQHLRILGIPQRDPGYEVRDVTDTFRKPAGKMRLNRMQSQSLLELNHCGGLLCLAGVGHGKTLLCMLAPLARPERKRPVLLLPPRLVDSYYRLRDQYEQHWVLGAPKILTYSQLSHPKHADLLERERPDMIICDEVHYLRNKKGSSRVRRLIRYFQAHPHTIFVGMSGSMTTKSLKDFEHLSRLALKENSPLPLKDARLLDAWAACVDSGSDPSDTDLARFMPFFSGMAKPGEYVDDLQARRAAFRRRLVTTPGVVTTPEQSCDATIVLFERTIEVPKEINEAVKALQESWRIDDNEIEDATALARAARELSQGFYYQWIWPDGKKDHEWIEKRSEWHRQVREALKHPRAGRDSPALLGAACARKEYPDVHPLYKAWLAWQEVKGRFNPTPPRRPVWVSNYFLKDALTWVSRQKKPVIIWYTKQAVEQVLKFRGIPTYGAGTTVPTDRYETIALSINAHLEGLNLQAWDRQIILDPPANGKTWEQMLGRTHRQGQAADAVYGHVYQHTDVYRAAYMSAFVDAQYIEENTTQRQKLNMVTRAIDKDADYDD